MTSLAGFATQMNPTTQVVCAYASGSKTVKALTYERWLIIGTFDVPENVRARLIAFGLATTGTTARVALFDTARIAASTLTLVAGGVEQAVVSEPFDLVAGVSYKVAIDCRCDSVGEELFAVLRTVALRDV